MVHDSIIVNINRFE